MKTFKNIIKYFIVSVTILLFAFAVYLGASTLIAKNKNQFTKIFGYSFSRVVTGSMVDVINIDDTIIFKYEKYDDIVKQVTTNIDGELLDFPIIVFLSSNGMNVVHRAIGVEDGQLITKGDNNNSVDLETVSSNNYIGVVATKLGTAKLYKFLESQSIFFVLIILVILVIIIFETIRVFSIIKQKNHEKEIEKYRLETKTIVEDERERLRDELHKEIEQEQEK